MAVGDDTYKRFASTGPAAEERLALEVIAFACRCGFIVTGLRQESTEESVVEHVLVGECLPDHDAKELYWFRGTLRAFHMWVKGKSRMSRRIT